MPAYYNEIDPFCVQWLRNLVGAGHLPAGDVDERPIQEVAPDDLASYEQVHLFAGLGGWPHALRRAGVPDDRSVWTGSCPCQSFSQAGQRNGFADDRHLWPHFYRLVAERRPPIVLGEQVASPLGRAWMSHVRADLEAVEYAVGAVDLCSAGIGAPHIRQRLYWVADTGGEGRQQVAQGAPSDEGPHGGQPDGDHFAAGDGADGSYERQFLWLECTDGRARPTEPGLFPVAHGVPSRLGRIRAYGNAIDPRVAEEFVRAYLG